MKALTIVALLLLLLEAVVAGAQEPAPADLMIEWRALHRECRSGETATGDVLTVDESDKSCQRLARVREMLADADYCWDASEYDWVAPGDVDTAGKACPVAAP